MRIWSVLVFLFASKPFLGRATSNIDSQMRRFLLKNDCLKNVANSCHMKKTELQEREVIEVKQGPSVQLVHLCEISRSTDPEVF